MLGIPVGTVMSRLSRGRENGIGVFYWLDDRFGYAHSSEMEKPDLLRVTTAVYQQLNP